MEGTTHRDHALLVDDVVRQRYTAAAREVEPVLCCPVDYDPELLKVIPREVLERDYGCGDPSQYVASDETVLDLGAGGGKACFIASQVVGATGQVIGVDVNDEMLSLARRYRRQVGESLGFHNVTFRKARIQDLKLDLEVLDAWLLDHPVHSSGDWLRLQEEAERLRETSPMIADATVDVVVSNCVLNLVRHDDRRALFSEMYRVLVPGGRAVISDIVCDEDVPVHLQADPELWSGCMGGAFREDRFLDAFVEAGFYGVDIVARPAEPWAVIEGIEFRSVTVRAFADAERPGLDLHQAVMYAGPWQAVVDDHGHRFERGRRVAVSDAAFERLTRAPFRDQVIAVPPHHAVAPERAEPFGSEPGTSRPVAVTKGTADRRTELPLGDCCGPDGCGP